MFKKLHLKFLLFNLTTTTIVLAFSFNLIYFAAAFDIKDNNNKRLDALIEALDASDINFITHDLGHNDSRTVFNLNYPSFFVIIVDSNFQPLAIAAQSQPDNFYQHAELVNQVLAHPSFTYTTVKFYAEHWEYILSPTTDNNYYLAFIEVSWPVHFLRQFAISMVLIAIFLEAIIFIISYFFASRAIRPIVQAWQKQKNFIVSGSHDFKTPLAIITSNLAILQSNRHQTIASQQQWLKHIQIGTNRLNKLLEMLIATASFDVTDLVLHHQNFNLSQALQETIQFFTVKIKEKNLTLTSDITPNLYLFGDPDLANHLFTVLLDNAVKYSNQGGEIKIYLYRHVHHLHLNISNTGKGIDSHNLPYVFDRFFRDDKARSQKVAGYGLGLTVAKNIINRLNGTIIVTSIPHRFTTFKITLPLKQSPQ